MKVLILGPYGDAITECVESCGDKALMTDANITLEFLEKNKIEFIISYGYKYLIKEPILSNYEDKIINLHISYLPWNRGYYPNVWSFLKDTPKGVTIHYIDSGINTGDIIIQREVKFSNKETLASTYNLLRDQIEVLFQKDWHRIRVGQINRTKQTGKGSLNYKRGLLTIRDLLTKGWETPVRNLTQEKSLPRKPGLIIRPARQSDAELLFNWVNEPSSLAGKLRTKEPIDWQTHIDWLGERCASENCQIWCIELAEGTTPIAQVRAEIVNDKLEVDIFVSREHRSRGIAAEALRRTQTLAKEKFSKEYMFARVRRGNTASKRLFLGVGYTKFLEFNDHDLLRLDLNLPQNCKPQS